MGADIDKKDLKETEKGIQIYDFLVQTNLSQNIQDILIKKHQSEGLKTKKEWELITEIKVL